MRSMLCPVLIGRGSELHVLTSALDRARSGDGGMVVLAGDAGVGKSRLAREAAHAAHARGFVVLAGRAAESAVPVPFRPVTEALMKAARTGLTPDAGGIGGYRRALGALVPEWRRPEDGDAEISAILLGEALLRLLTSHRWPGALLVLEDLHWAAPETLAIIEYLADNLAGSHVLCIATVRDGEPSPGLDTLKSVAARRAASMLAVPRLTSGLVAQMAAACLEVDELPDGVARMLARSDGLPFAVEEILAAAVSSGELVRRGRHWQVNENVTTAVPASIAGSVRRRLADLGPQASGVVAAAAVLGRRFDWELLPAVAQVPEADALAALRRARELQLIEPAGAGAFRFRHALTRDAILSDLLPPDLARRSRIAADAVEQASPSLPGSACELAAELRAGAGQHKRAAELMLLAGQRALRQGALGTAIASLTDAARLHAAAGQAGRALLADIQESLVRAYALAGDHARLAPLAEELLGRLADLGADPARQAIVRIYAARTRSAIDPVAAAAHLSAARAIADQLGDPVLEVRIDVVAARCALEVGEVDRAGELARACLARAEAAGLTGWAADVGFEALEVIGRRERLRDVSAARQAFDRAFQIAVAPGFAIRQIRALHDLGAIDALDQGSWDRLEEARGLAVHAGAKSTTVVIDLQLARALSLSSELDRALEAAGHARQQAAELRLVRAQALAESAGAVVLGIRGEGRKAERALERAEQLAPDDPQLLASAWGDARVTRSLFADDLPRAADEIAAGIRYARKDPLTATFPAWGYWPLLSAALGQDGERALAEARAAGAEVSRFNRGLLAHAEAVLAGRAGDAARAGQLAGEGEDQLRPFAPRWLHLARRIAAPAAIRDGWGDPVAWLRAATGDLEACGHERLASACRGLLRRSGERVPRPGRATARVPAQMRRLGITSREMDVLALVAQGYSNAEIADRLYISPKTVETHVASLVAKTGQAGRRELVAHAARLAGN